MILPDSFSNYTSSLMGEQLYSCFLQGLQAIPPVSVRMNRSKCDDVPEGGILVPWCDCGYYLGERPAFTFDPLLHAGYYYVQEASSMFVHHVLRQYVDKPVRMLDMCAAPGGKSTAALGALPAGSTLMSNEPVRARAQILAENIQKWGNPNVIVTNNYPKDYARSGLLFDVILCDVPCSGEGMFRKDEGAVAEWSVQNVENCRQLQREIVEEAWQCLEPGGLLIYSTCTFNAKENEENVAWICENLGAEALPVDIKAEWGIRESLVKDINLPVCRFIPGCTQGEGLFMAVLRKTSDEYKRGGKHGKIKPLKADSSISKCLLNPEEFVFYAHGNDVIAVPKCINSQYDTAAQSLKIIHAGIKMGTVKGKDFIPDQSLALSTALNRNAFALAELDYGQAINYLRRDAISLPQETARGFVLLTYKDAPLGFVKNIGNRVNNMYPQEWRIRTMPNAMQGKENQ